MAADLPRPSTEENVSTTLSSVITDVAGSMDVADASKIVDPCYLVIDRVDSAGTLKDTSFWEYVKVTNVTSNTLTITRGQNGSTQQAHSSGAVVEAVVTSAMFEDWYTALNPEHTVSGGHVITGTMTIAGMNLASVATIAVGTFNHLRANASTSGLGLGIFPTFVMPNRASAATISLGKPLAVPRAFTAQAVSVTLRSPVSSASIIFDVNKNFVSIFQAGTRPSILGGGTYVSTASLNTKNVDVGDIITVDLDAGGSYKDATLTILGY